jgi:hypothetical protein
MQSYHTVVSLCLLKEMCTAPLWAADQRNKKRLQDEYEIMQPYKGHAGLAPSACLDFVRGWRQSEMTGENPIQIMFWAAALITNTF